MLASRLLSFTFAGRGVLVLLSTQPNARIHAFATLVVCAAGLRFGLRGSEWCMILFALGGVWTAEAVDTSLEFLADHASPGYHPLIRDAKDVAAAAVLITAIIAALIGAIVFVPYLANLTSSSTYIM